MYCKIEIVLLNRHKIIDILHFRFYYIELALETGEEDEFGNTEYDLQIEEDGEMVSTEIMKYGDVEYDSDNSALLFNESEDNEDGEGGYLSLTRSGVDFSSGFTFEIYANLSRLTYYNNATYGGLFCRMSSLSETFFNALRFGFTSGGLVQCKFYNASSWHGSGSSAFTLDAGNVTLDESLIKKNEDFYLTFVYITYNEGTADSYQEEYYEEYEIEIDRVDFYLNGELCGYSYYGHDNYQTGCNTWNKDKCPFFLGVCPWYATGNLYYLKGSVYTCRLYTTSMTEEQVEESYNKTLQYRNSFAKSNTN